MRSHWIVALLDSGDEAMDRHRRWSFVFCLVLLVPIVTYLGWTDHRAGRLFESKLVFSMAALLTVLAITAIKVEDARPVYRTAALAALLLLTYEVAIGASTGRSFLWLYLFPTLLVVLLGRREGLLWVLAAVVSSAVFLLTPLGFQYPPGVAWRFLVTFGVVTLFSYSLESSRKRYEQELHTERENLRQALEKVVTLRGLLPMCPSCKKVRRDGGYWEQIEDLLERQADVRFSHGLCPDCVEKALVEIEEA